MVEEIDHKFLYHLCEMFGKLPSDPFFDEIDPVEKLWLFHSWLRKQGDYAELLKDQGILIGAFSNLEMAKDMSKKPSFESSEEEYEASWEYIQSQPISEKAKLEARNALMGISNEDNFRQSRRRKRKVVPN